MTPFLGMFLKTARVVLLSLPFVSLPEGNIHYDGNYRIVEVGLSQRLFGADRLGLAPRAVGKARASW